MVVEGNTDVLALRQAGFDPVVACMGTALTAPQLTELGRLTKRLWLAFDGDAAGESATLRGMELAAQQGFDVKIVALPPGVDPADDPAGFDARSARRGAVPRLPRAGRDRACGGPRGCIPGGEGAPRYRARHAREARGVAHRERPARPDDSAARNGLGHGVSRTLGLAAAARRRRAASSGACSPPRSPIRICGPLLAELRADHFDDALHRAIRAHVVDGSAARRRRASGSTPSSTPRPPPRGSRTRPGRSCC